MSLKYIYSPNSMQAYTAWDDLYAVDPEDFDDIILKYMEINYPSYDDDEFEYTIEQLMIWDLFGAPGISTAFVADLANKEPGEFTEPVQVDDVYYIFIVDSAEIPPEDEISDYYRMRYISEQKAYIFAEILMEMKNDANVQINEKGYINA